MKKLGFGFMRLPRLEGSDQIDLPQVCDMVDLYLSKGFSYFDMAYVYSGSEVAFRESVSKRHPRDRFSIATKLTPITIRCLEDRERIFNEQLENCGVEYFDNYLIHNIGLINYQRAKKFDLFEFAKQKKAEGKIKHIGFSIHDTPELVEEILTEHPEMEFVQLQMNYLDWDSPSIQSRRCYEVCCRYGKPVSVMEPVKGGLLAQVPEAVEKLFREYSPELSAPSWAVRFAASHENVFVVLSGMSNLAQVEDNVSYMDDFKPFSKEELAIVEQAAGLIKRDIAIACTGCSYCTAGCPKKLLIPQYFSLFNDFTKITRFKVSSPIIYKMYYKNLVENGAGAPAKDCINCGQCERICPQHLPVAELLKNFSKEFDVDLFAGLE